MGQSSQKIDSDIILNFQEFSTILNAGTKKVWKLNIRGTFVLPILRAQLGTCSASQPESQCPLRHHKWRPMWPLP